MSFRKPRSLRKSLLGQAIFCFHPHIVVIGGCQIKLLRGVKVMKNPGFITLKEATQQIMKVLNKNESVENFNLYYRPLLDKVNKGEIPSEKRGRKNLVHKNDLTEYIEKLKEEEAKILETAIFVTDENGEFQINDKLRVFNDDAAKYKQAIEKIDGLVKVSEFFPPEDILSNIRQIVTSIK